MKYKIGDKVKIREDLKGGCEYGGMYFATDMEIYSGKIATITKIEKSKAYRIDFNTEEWYRIDLDEGTWYWSDDMFENNAPTKKQSNDMKKLEDIVLKKGDIVEFDDGEILDIYASDGENAQILKEISIKIVKSIKRPVEFKTIYEAPQPILDKEEKEWLEHFLRPFRNKVKYKVKYIVKCEANHNEEFIYVGFLGAYVWLPGFKKGTMYKGMEADKEYTLKELGLFE